MSSERASYATQEAVIHHLKRSEKLAEQARSTGLRLIVRPEILNEIRGATTKVTQSSK